MGLDQYGYTRRANETPLEKPADFKWCKHAKLQEFMERLFMQRTGLGTDDFNCHEFELTQDDINFLEHLVKIEKLPESEGGFFYGHEFQDESAKEYKAQDLEFCKWAKTILESREKVFYSCWW